MKTKTTIPVMLFLICLERMLV